MAEPPPLRLWHSRWCASLGHDRTAQPHYRRPGIRVGNADDAGSPAASPSRCSTAPRSPARCSAARRARAKRTCSSPTRRSGRSTPSSSRAARPSASMLPAACRRSCASTASAFPSARAGCRSSRRRIVFDLLNGGDKDWSRYPPYRELGYIAAAAAGADFALGTAGGGYGATTATSKAASARRAPSRARATPSARSWSSTPSPRP